jgi:TnpA family transposase
MPLPPIAEDNGVLSVIDPTALRLGTAETEAILKRFTRNNLKHPTYLAFTELGKAIKTIFLCRYLHSEALRREIQEGQLRAADRQSDA